MSANEHHTRWKHDGIKVIPAGSLEPSAAQTQGMNRKTAIDFARTGASKLWGGTATIHLIVTGSVRPNSVNEKIVPLVVSRLEDKGANVTIANLKELDLPFYDDPSPSLSSKFNPTDERVKRWTAMVGQADGVVLVTPEYNHTMSPVQLNAVDWVGKEWQDKPVALVGYGWSGGSRAHITARENLAASGLKARVGEKQANLPFKKDIDVDGSILDEPAVSEKISAALDEMLEMTR